jgi:hypothetical protein
METTVDNATGIASTDASSPTYQAYQILHFGFTIAPILAGLDKFLHLLTNWDQYLAPSVNRMLGGNGHLFMQAVGVIPGYFDVALRDLGLSLGAFALARLSAVYDR